MAKDEFGLNKEHLAIKGHDDYIETLLVNGHLVNVFMNDYGQCYWFQWLNNFNEIESLTCGTYVVDYKSEIEDFFNMYEKFSRPKEDDVGNYICPFCKEQIDLFHFNDKYCGNCGKKLNWEDICKEAKI